MGPVHTRHLEDTVSNLIFTISTQYLRNIYTVSTQVGSLLLTPVQLIFTIITRDPLDSLEPDMFQVSIMNIRLISCL